jgi:hypothetical protein
MRIEGDFSTFICCGDLLSARSGDPNHGVPPDCKQVAMCSKYVGPQSNPDSIGARGFSLPGHMRLRLAFILQRAAVVLPLAGGGEAKLLVRPHV